jgi:hypothetical protein
MCSPFTYGSTGSCTSCGAGSDCELFREPDASDASVLARERNNGEGDPKGSDCDPKAGWEGDRLEVSELKEDSLEACGTERVLTLEVDDFGLVSTAVIGRIWGGPGSAGGIGCPLAAAIIWFHCQEDSWDSNPLQKGARRLSICIIVKPCQDLEIRQRFIPSAAGRPSCPNPQSQCMCPE